MNKIFSPYLIIAGLMSLVYFIPQNIFSAELTFQVLPDSEIKDNVTVVEVRIDPQSKKINVVEGTIVFSGSATKDLSVQIENGNSVLPLWPTPPQYISAENAIHFIGGVPDGFDKEGLLFVMRISSLASDDLDVSYTNGSAYLNDGKGTKENVSSKPLQINVNQSADKNINNQNLFLNKNKYGIIIFGVIILFFFVFYGYKKITKK